MMNFRTAVTILSLFFLTTLVKAQYTMHKMISVGYTYQNQSFGEVGGKLLFLKNDDVIYRLGGSALMGVADSKFAIMPKLQADVLLNFEKNVDFYHSYYFLVGAEGTNKYIAPKIGVTLFGMLDLTGGYAFPIGDTRLNGKEMKGLNINFTLNIPTVFIHDMFK
ncbi:hypothetical protein EGY07_00100 [Chryseobacterium indologenes]|uniref:Uncharacterized protein n=2 Tax=Chryseobacterium indologenes TaxID=253 RepID=A0AAD0YTJ6_CHRID|nr:hypothetical protein [Chryseobacterium indologenes]ASE63028.1 hypothetical protein CEQ15_16805 [Chryseobacterium indologenes]ATN06936.1 hypothetical protein CRN76_16755 [Chryseobacterium indologenes]AYY84319.1 hypothetical protein EGX91_07040 [Chryseobacterium indologenes]AYZ34076.1 hypothetical protein EGY07_00100 [Chryseobacterium indologenes]AZB18724.1 hypothetical protein EG352_13525 [Chryseobacterium indologenes]